MYYKNREWHETYDEKKERLQKQGDVAPCFVATAIGFEPELMQRFYNVRDEILVREFLGRVFIKIYYNGIGEFLAKVILFSSILKSISKRILLKILVLKENKNVK